MAKIVSTGTLPAEESKYFAMHLLSGKFRTSQFYGMPKVHKDILPVPLQPVVSTIGSFGSAGSTYIDFKLQLFTKHLCTYTRNSQMLVNELSRLGKLPDDALLSTHDANAMYVHIHKEEGLPVIRKYLETYGHESDSPIDIDIVMDLLTLIISHSIFKFGDTW